MNENLKTILEKIKEKKIIGTTILSVVFIIIFFINLGIASNVTLNHLKYLDTHPDENAHFQAVKYYTKHFMPPKFTSDEIDYSFTEYGESRLTELDSYYFFNGKFTSILNLFSENKVFNSRCFNLMLFVIIAIFSIRLYRKGSYVFMPFLLTSQLWYIFSYVNNDAWAIFWNLIFVYQLFYKKSAFNNLINSDVKKLKKEKKKTIIKILLLGVLFYLLLILKINFLIATGISAIIYLIVNHKKAFKKENIIKIGLILLIGLVCFGIRLIIDVAINGLDRYTSYEEIRLSKANDMYKPPYDGVEGFKLKDKGMSISDVLALNNGSFFMYTKMSFIGVYGYMDKLVDGPYYGIILKAYVIFVLYIIIMNVAKIFIERIKRKNNEIFKFKTWEKGRVSPIVLAFIAFGLVLCFSIYRSYTYDYQAQGRYLFPIIPIVCALMYNQKKSKLVEAFFFVIAIVLIVMYYQFGYMAFKA